MTRIIKYCAQILHLLCILLGSKCIGAEIEQHDLRDELELQLKKIVISANLDDQVLLDFEALNRLANQELRAFGYTVSLAELHQIAENLTLRYRQAGYIFHTVYVMPQEIDDGVVYFGFIQARLADINIINKSDIEDREVLAMFRPLLGKPLRASRVEDQINLLKTVSNTHVFPYYSKGKEARDIRLNIKLDPIKKSNFSVVVNNYGLKSTGEHQFVARANKIGLLSSFDQASIAWLSSIYEGDTTHGFVSYRTPINQLRNYLNVNFGDGSYSVGKGFNTLGLSGNSKSYSVGFGQILKKTNSSHLDLSLSLKRTESSASSELSGLLDNQQVSDQLSVDFFIQKLFKENYVYFSSAYTAGEFATLDLRSKSKGLEFDLIRYSLVWQYSKILSKSTSIQSSISLDGQYTEHQLPDLEEFGLTGFHSVRSITPGKYSANRANLARFELSLSHTANQQLYKSYLFFDSAKGQQFNQFDLNGMNKVVTNYELSGLGLGLSASRGSWKLDVSVAKTLKERARSRGFFEEVDSEERILFELSWR